MVKWPWNPPGQRWSTVYVTVASTSVGVGEADAVGVGEAGGVGVGERATEALADGDADGERVGAAVTWWCAGAGRADSLPRGVPSGAALALGLPGSAAVQLTMPQSFATRRPSWLFIRMIAPVASAAAATPASRAPYHR